MSWEMRYAGAFGKPEWVDIRVFTPEELKSHVKGFVDSDFDSNGGEIVFGYQAGWLEDATRNGWFDYDKYMEEEAENDLYDIDGNFLPDSKSREDIMDFIQDETSMEIILRYIDRESIYNHYIGNPEETIPSPMGRMEEVGGYSVLFVDP